MITIEEKMKLFTNIVYDKVEKYNQNTVENFNKEYGNLIENKKSEFTKEAEYIYTQGIKDIQKEKLQILSKAKVEEKRIVLNERKKIFEETIKALFELANGYVKTEEYKKMILSELSKALNEVDDSSVIEIIFTENDMKKFKYDIENILKNRTYEIKSSDELVGGFVIIDTTKNIKMDMSIASRIENSRNLVGEKLFDILQ